MKKIELGYVKIRISSTSKALAMNAILINSLSYKSSKILDDGALELKIKASSKAKFQSVFGDNAIEADFSKNLGAFAYISRYNRRFGLFLGALLLFICVYVSSLFVWKIDVEDTGIGIKPEHKEKLFAKFERIEVQRNRNIEGTGLGMPITMRLLSLMDSELKVESEYGKGSVFSFDLRQKIIEEAPIGDYENKTEIQAMIDDATVTTANLRKFSEKLNKRFLLFRLLF